MNKSHVRYYACNEDEKDTFLIVGLQPTNVIAQYLLQILVYIERKKLKSLNKGFKDSMYAGTAGLVPHDIFHSFSMVFSRAKVLLLLRCFILGFGIMLTHSGD